MVKIDPYKHKERYIKWKKESKKGIPEISKYDSDLILKYLEDMEMGLNVAVCTKKGSRSYVRLNSLKIRLISLSRKFREEYGIEEITDITEIQVHKFFTGMRNGTILKQDKKPYKSTADFVKIFKAFWHWWQKVNKKQGIEILDITADLDTSCNKPEWVYLTEEQIRQLCGKANYEYRILIMFLFDTGIRAPTELMNLKVSDLYNDYKEVNIRDEISKTFGRRIKLMICSKLLKEYVEKNKLGSDDYLFDIIPAVVNRYFKRLSKKLFGEKDSPAGQKYSELTMYDFRHIACCYWLPRYKSESALKYRFGWKKSDKIHYYSELLGMKDTISEEDLLVDITKTEIEKRLTKSEHENEMMREEMDALRKQTKMLMELMDKAFGGVAMLEAKILN